MLNGWNILCLGKHSYSRSRYPELFARKFVVLRWNLFVFSTFQSKVAWTFWLFIQFSKHFPKKNCFNLQKTLLTLKQIFFILWYQKIQSKRYKKKTAGDLMGTSVKSCGMLERNVQGSLLIDLLTNFSLTPQVKTFATNARFWSFQSHHLLDILITGSYQSRFCRFNSR